MPKPVDDVKQSRLTANEGSLLEALHDVVHALRAQHRRSAQTAGAGLSPLEARVLQFFGSLPGATQSDLAEHTGRDKGQLARLMAGLRERGWLATRVDPGDRRIVRVELTAQGKRLNDAMALQRRRLDTEVSAAFDPQESRAFIALLRRLQRQLEDAA